MTHSAARPAELDLAAYFTRVGYAGPTTPSVATLQGLHEAHATSVPFENLDIFLGRPIRLDLSSLQAKLVAARRGGYCFEQNLLFGAVLEALGFSVTRLAARVRLGASHVLPRTHMLLKIDIDGTSHLADVGFGGEGPLRALPIEDGAIAHQGAWSFRLVREGATWVLESMRPEGPLGLYAFDLTPQLAVDYEVANWYTSTHPDSRFLHTMTAQRLTPTARHVLRDRELVLRDGQHATSLILTERELLVVLAETFGLVFPPGTRFVSPLQGRH